MNNVVNMNNFEKTMTSSQLAELLGKPKKKINEKIREMFPAEIDGSEIKPSKP